MPFARDARHKSAMTEAAPDPQPADPVAAGHAATRSITRLSVGVAVLLIAIKAFALGASGSVSILASLTDSALDLAACAVAPRAS